MALSSPLFLALVLAGVAKAYPPLRLVLLPAGLNFANFVLFVLAMATLRNVRR